jgi:hypothetical protein
MRQEVKPYETVSVNKWASGAYMLILQDENHYGLQKFIKE